MNILRTGGTPALVFTLLFAAFGWSQANINESSETAHLYVDAVSGSDSNPGTSAQPFRTIGKSISAATNNNRANVGTKVTINPGVYREMLSIGRDGRSTSKPMTFQAAQAGTVIISGADKWTGWTAWSGHQGVFTHAWTYRWGSCPTTSGVYEAPVTLRREMVFVNGANLTQVMSLGQLAAGTFYVDESHGLVYAQPAPGTSMASADVEVPVRNNVLTTFNAEYVVLRGLTFAEANNCRDTAAAVMIYGGSQILMDQDQFNWNNSAGLQLSSVQNFTVQNSFANHNGESGFGSDKSKYGQWTSNEADYNSWRSAQGAIYGWNSGGFHFFQQHNNTINGAISLYNQSHGLHWDTDNENITATGIISARNLGIGTFIEKSQGPLSISGSKVCNDGTLGIPVYGGIGLRTSTYVTLTNNTIANNGQEVPILGITGGVPIQVTNYETGASYRLLTTNLTMSSNTIVGGAGEQLVRNANQSGNAWSMFHSTLGSDYNTWWNAAESQPFMVPVPRFGTNLDWAGWKSATGRDAHSTYGKPANFSCPSAADAPDFWLVDQDSGLVNVSPGGHGVFTLLVLPVGSFGGTVNLAEFGANTIPGASSHFSTTTVNGSGMLTFTVSPTYSTPPGNYPVTLSATSGGITRTMTVSLHVN